MNYQINRIEELVGKLQSLSDDRIIIDVTLKMSSSSAQKLAKVISSGNVQRENQDLFFTSIIVNSSKTEDFNKKRSFEDTSPYSITKYKGNFKTTVEGNDGELHLCEIKIGSIGFDLTNKIPDIVGEDAIFENISAKLFPFGIYKVFVGD